MNGGVEEGKDKYRRMEKKREDKVKWRGRGEEEGNNETGDELERRIKMKKMG